MKVNKVNTILGLLALCVVLIALTFYCFHTNLGKPVQHAQHFMLILFFGAVTIAICLALLLTRNIMLSARQEQLVEMQELHIEHLQEMMRVIKTQRHDFVNHLQTVYGLMKLGEVEQAENHITDLYQDVKISGEVLRIAIPEVTALLMVKMGVATSQNISVNIDVASDLAGLKVRPLDIVAVLGNMINNAMEAVEELEATHKKVELRIFEDSDQIFFQTHNPGFIPEDIQPKVFEAGFTTKVGYSNRGLGLASIRHLVTNYKGKVSLFSHPEQGTTFTVCFPA